MKLNMTVTSNEFGQQNMWAKEPRMYISKEDQEKYGLETYAEKAEKTNGRWAMMGFVLTQPPATFTSEYSDNERKSRTH